MTLRRGPSRRGGASGKRKRHASASRGHRASSTKSARARQTRRLSPCLPSFAAISPPAVPRATDACTMLGQRLDKWLWCARLVKTRTLAARLIEAGKIRINGERTLKVSRPVRAGDVVTGISAGAGRLFVVRVAGEAERRGPATVARTLYEDLTPAAPAPRFQRRARRATSHQARPQAARRHQGRRCIVCDCVLRAPPFPLEPWPCEACSAWHGLPCTGCAIGIGKAPHRPKSRGSKSRGRVARIGPNGRYALSQVG